VLMDQKPEVVKEEGQQTTKKGWGMRDRRGK
jgi:hypothetical protein